MSNTAECPHCKTENKIDEFPGEDGEVDVECQGCEREFVAIGQIRTSYGSRCKDGEHEYQASPGITLLVFCKRCDAFKRVEESTPAP